MVSKFQSRLVGTIILVAVGIIVLPDLFDGKKLHYKEEVASIPLKPLVDENPEVFEILEPVVDEVSLPDAPVEATIDESEPQQAIVTEAEPIEVTPEPEVVDVIVNEVAERNQYQDSAWIIQLVALKNKDNAINLVKDLQNRGYQAHTKEENGFTRVIIGPDVSKSKLEKQVTELEKITGSKGQLLKFKPLNP
ncbi:SPOR domain-containing protein [Vibrio agarivorans]|uniref:SPOR domain-containing protein n=1 Tax=Vibrio agarivorans TaxID=153622 RepID=A0ABT7XXY6_9VIBR|nr:SPOR domain-containing protein [Vibrio agarivorans]MDN2480646.1 SPOR domain-containing protein [Vibrio agarivorans]